MDVGRCSVMSSAARFYPLRLCPGEDLVLSLRRLVAGAGIQAGYIAGAVGSLSRVELRYAGRPEGTVRDGCFEIVSLIGTLDPAGEHLHMTVSDPERGGSCRGPGEGRHYQGCRGHRLLQQRETKRPVFRSAGEGLRLRGLQGEELQGERHRLEQGSGQQAGTRRSRVGAGCGGGRAEVLLPPFCL